MDLVDGGTVVLDSGEAQRRSGHRPAFASVIAHWPLYAPAAQEAVLQAGNGGLQLVPVGQLTVAGKTWAQMVLHGSAWRAVAGRGCVNVIIFI